MAESSCSCGSCSSGSIGSYYDSYYSASTSSLSSCSMSASGIRVRYSPKPRSCHHCEMAICSKEGFITVYFEEDQHEWFFCNETCLKNYKTLHGMEELPDPEDIINNRFEILDIQE